MTEIITQPISKTYKFRLHPNEEQQATLNQWFAGSRWLYNACLEQRSLWYDHWKTWGGEKPKLTAYSQDKLCGWATLKQYDDLAWIAEMPSECRQIALQDLDKAYDKFFKGGGYPKWRNARDNNSVRFQVWRGDNANVRFGKDCVKIPKIGWIKYNKHKKPYGRFGQATIKREGKRWYITLSVSQGERELNPDINNAVGIDMGVAVPAMLSTGEYMPKDLGLKTLDEKKKYYQRKVSRCKKGSTRRRSWIQRLAEQNRKISARRKSTAHEATAYITDKYSVIAVEDLKLSNMTKSAKGTIENPGKNVKAKAGLNRELANVAPHQFVEMLKYKAARKGGEVIKIDPKYTSQACSNCGTIAKENRKTQADFKCVDCGFEMNADMNAARNILMRALPGVAIDPRNAPSESYCGSATQKPIVSCYQPGTTTGYGPGTAHALDAGRFSNESLSVDNHAVSG